MYVCESRHVSKKEHYFANTLNGNGVRLTCVVAWPSDHGNGVQSVRVRHTRSTYRRPFLHRRHHGRVHLLHRRHLLLRHHRLRRIWRICPWTAPHEPCVRTQSGHPIHARRPPRPWRSQTLQRRSPVGCERSRHFEDFHRPQTHTPGRSCGHCCPGLRHKPFYRWDAATFCQTVSPNEQLLLCQLKRGRKNQWGHENCSLATPCWEAS